MTCPDSCDTFRHEPGTQPNAAAREHVRSCPACRLDLLLEQAVCTAFQPEPERPGRLGELNELVLGRMARRRVGRATVRPADAWLTALLGTLTTAAAIVTTGGHLQPGATVLELTLFAAAGGVCTVCAQLVAGRRERALAIRAAHA